MTKTYSPINDYIVIDPEYETEFADGLIKVPGQYVEHAAPSGFDGRKRNMGGGRIALSSRTCTGTVVAVGPGCSRRVEDGEPDDFDAPWGPKVPIDDVKPGDRVIFERTSSAYLDNDLVIVRYEAVWSVIGKSLDVQTTQVD